MCSVNICATYGPLCRARRTGVGARRLLRCFALPVLVLRVLVRYGGDSVWILEEYRKWLAARRVPGVDPPSPNLI